MSDSKPVLTLRPEQVAELVEALDGGEKKIQTEDGRNLAAVLLGRRGGLKGGKARAEALSAEQRSAIARRAAQKRWAKKP